MQVHVGSAVLAAPVLAWHLLRHRRQRLRRRDLSRRTLLRTGALAVGVAATYGTLEGIGRLAGSAAASRIATGSHHLSPNAVPATMWLFDQVPMVAADHRVHVAGEELTVPDLASRSTTVAARLDCTSGWYTDAAVDSRQPCRPARWRTGSRSCQHRGRERDRVPPPLPRGRGRFFVAGYRISGGAAAACLRCAGTPGGTSSARILVG